MTNKRQIKYKNTGKARETWKFGKNSTFSVEKYSQYMNEANKIECASS